MIGLTKSLAREWAPLRINVNAVAPGFIETKLNGGPPGGRRVRHPGRDAGAGARADPDRPGRAAVRRRGARRVALCPGFGLRHRPGRGDPRRPRDREGWMTKVMTLEDAARLVEDGDVVALQNMATQAAPMALVRELIRQEKRNLGLVCLVGGMPVDWLAAAGVIDRFHRRRGVDGAVRALPGRTARAVEEGRDPRRGAVGDVPQRAARRRRPQPPLPPHARPHRDRPDRSGTRTP